MSVPFITFETGEPLLDWLELTEALAEGHRMPRAEIADSFLYRGKDTLLSRVAWIDGLGQLVKTATIFPGNAALDQPTINGAVSIFADANGTLEAMVDFRLVTKWKTAADSLLAALHLAPQETHRILVLGAGTVAASLIEAFRAGFPGAEIALWNRSETRARALAQACGIELETDLPKAVLRADIILGATMSIEPVLKGEWLRPGQHVNLIGAFRPDMREADDTAIRRARIYVDSKDTTLDHIGELKIPLSQGTIERGDIAGDFYDLESFTRTSPKQITLFKNGGGAHLDLMTASYILGKWRSVQ